MHYRCYASRTRKTSKTRVHALHPVHRYSKKQTVLPRPRERTTVSKIRIRRSERFAELMLVCIAAACCVLLILPTTEGTASFLAATCLGAAVIGAALLDRSRRRKYRQEASGCDSPHTGGTSVPERQLVLDAGEHGSLFPPASSILASPGAPFDPKTGLDTMVAPLSTPSAVDSD